jgi:hypothetical protein
MLRGQSRNKCVADLHACKPTAKNSTVIFPEMGLPHPLPFLADVFEQRIDQLNSQETGQAVPAFSY